MGASVWPDEWRRGNKWDGEAGEGSCRSPAGRWAALAPDPLPTPPLGPMPPGGRFCPPRCPQPPGDRRPGSLRTRGSPGVAGQGEWGLAWRGKAGWCWGCWSEGWASPRGQRQQSQGRDRVGSPQRGELRPTSAGPGHRSPTSPAGGEQLPPLEPPPHPPSVGHGPHGEQGGAPHQNLGQVEGLRHFTAQKRDAGVSRGHGDPQAQQTPASLPLYRTGGAPQLSCPWGCRRRGDRAAELGFLHPGLPFTLCSRELVPSPALAQECLRGSGATLLRRQSHYKITQLEAGAHQIQP